MYPLVIPYSVDYYPSFWLLAAGLTEYVFALQAAFGISIGYFTLHCNVDNLCHHIPTRGAWACTLHASHCDAWLYITQKNIPARLNEFYNFHTTKQHFLYTWTKLCKLVKMDVFKNSNWWNGPLKKFIYFMHCNVWHNKIHAIQIFTWLQLDSHKRKSHIKVSLYSIHAANSPFEAGQNNKLTIGRPEDSVGTATNTLWGIGNTIQR